MIVPVAVTLAQVSRQTQQAVGGFILLGGLAVIIVAALVAAHRANKARRAKLEETLRAMGFTFTGSPAKIDKPALYEPFAHTPQFSHGAAGIQWAAQGRIAGATVHVAEHMHMQSHGKGAHPVHHTAAAVACPAPWPTLSLTREHWGHALANLLGARDVQLDDEAFNKRWRLKCDQPDFALLFLSPQAQTWLAAAPRNESWHLQAGRLVCVRHGTVKDDAIAALAARPAELMALVPPELAAWGTDAS